MEAAAMVDVHAPRTRRVPRLLLIPAVLICGLAIRPAAGAAQTVTGTIQGTVTDTTGAAVPGALITIQNLETNTTREVSSSDQGLYSAPFLLLGRYKLTATLAGFGAVVREASVALNNTTVVDFRLNPAIEQTTTVVAEPPRINTTTQEVKQSLSAEQISDRPTALNINNNNTFLSLAETFAGFQENPTSGQNNPTASSGSSINFNGTGTRGTTFQIDGVNNDDSSENQNRQGVSLAAIKEFQVISNSYTAEFGRGYGAVVLVQTKSGANQIHGEASFARQDSEWNAMQAFATVRPNNQRPNYAGVVGFPVARDRLFGFVSADYGRQEGDGPYVRDLFTDAEKALPRLTRGNDTPANRAFQDSVLARFAGLQPNDSRSIRTFQTVAGLDRPTVDTSQRVDWNINTNDRFTGRYQYSRQKFDNTDVIVGETTQQLNDQANIGLTWTRALTSRAVGELRFGLGVRDTNVNIKAGNDTPIIRFAGSPVSGSIIGNAGTFPILRDQKDYQLVYNLSTLFGGGHNVKAGTDIRLSHLDDLADNFSRGFWSFSAACGGVTYPSSWAAFMDGCVTSFTKAYGPFALENRINEYNFYAEDNWRVGNNLTVNLGVRYEYAGAAREANDLVDYRYGDDANNIQPRLGVAWTPNWTTGVLGALAGDPGAFSIRSGYGLYHGRIFQSAFSQGGASIRTNPPNAISLAISTLPNILSLADPTLGFVFTPGPQTTRHSETLPSPDLEMPETHQWNLSLERQMPWRSTLRLTYSGSRGTGLLRYVPDNLAVTPADGGIVVVNHPNNAPAAGAPDLRGVRIDRVAADWRCAGTGFIPNTPVNVTCPVAVPIANNEISLRVPRINERRPDPRFTTNLIVTNDANTWYNGLQTEWTKTLQYGLWFSATYTWSKAIDDTSEATFVGAGDSNQLGRNKGFARGPSRFHTPHRFTFNGSYHLPFLRERRDWLGLVAGGWQVSAVVKLAHGTPFTVVDSAGGDLDWDGFSESRPIILDPSIIGTTIGDIDTAEQDLPRSAFLRATPEDFADLVGRNTFYADGVRNVDVGLTKNMYLPGDDRLLFRVELYNVFNRRQWAFPSNDIASTTFGRITSQFNSARALQVHVRYIF
jgi:Carboxypeptidase regulatory-like domain/TonB dependent receptor/TonB-dependent Receptor Plug Domain